MKQLSDEEISFLFEFVKNWYPTEKNPKIAIVLMNRQEWKDFYEKFPKIRLDNATKELVKKNPELKDLLDRLDELPKEQREKIIGNLDPHNAGAIIDMLKMIPSPFEAWMNEVNGVTYNMAEERYGVEKGIFSFLHPFFKPFIDTYDFVIIISDFFNKEQTKTLASKGFKAKDVVIQNTIFHELIHVIEHCNNVLIFTSNNISECLKVTAPITRKWFE